MYVGTQEVGSPTREDCGPLVNDYNLVSVGCYDPKRKGKTGDQAARRRRCGRARTEWRVRTDREREFFDTGQRARYGLSCRKQPLCKPDMCGAVSQAREL